MTCELSGQSSTPVPRCFAPAALQKRSACARSGSLDLMKLAFWAAAAICLLYALHRTALWMECRGWIFYEQTKASSSAMSNAFMQVQAMFEPAAQYVVERRRTDEVGESDSGDPPTPSANGLP